METIRPPKESAAQEKDSTIAEGRIVQYQSCAQKPQTKELLAKLKYKVVAEVTQRVASSRRSKVSKLRNHAFVVNSDLPKFEQKERQSATDAEELKRLEKKFTEASQANFDGVIVRGEVLAAIRERKLYRQHYPTFDQYCQRQLRVKRKRATS